jgi:HrpA-like RNA helicase
MSVRFPENSMMKRAFVLLLACVLALAGTMQLRASATSLLSEEKVPQQRLYEETEHKRVLDIRRIEERQGLKPIKRQIQLAQPAPRHLTSRTARVRRPAAPRAPPHFPRAPPFVA